MGTTRLNKEGIVVKDIIFGMNSFDDSRGTQEEVNSSHLPFTGIESVEQAIANRYTKSEIQAAYALLAGLSSQVFDVATATDATHAVPKAQLDSLLSTKANQTDVDNKANKTNVLLVDGSSAVLVPTMDAQPANKKYVDDKITDIGAGDMTRAVYDVTNSGMVDSSEGVGRADEPMGISNRNQVMRLSQSNVLDANNLTTFGIFVGTDVANGPVSGGIVIEQFLAVSSGKVQRATDGLGVVYNRYYNANSTTWSLWKAVGVAGDFLPLTGGTVTGQIKGISPLDPQDLSRKDYVDTKVAQLGYDTKQSEQDALILINTGKVGITTAQSDAIVLNTAKTGVTTEVKSGGEGGTRIVNMISMTQDAYNALTPVATTMYVIKG